MAVKTFRLTDTNDVDGAALLADGVDQSVASRSTGKWTVAKVASGNSSDYNALGIQGSGSFSLDSTSPKPVAGGTNAITNFVTPTALTGTFAATAWTLTFAVRAATASSQAGRVRVRVFKSLSNISVATELTSAVLVGTTSAALSTTADVTSVVTWSPGALTLAAQFLFFTLAWEITTASGSNNGDVIFRLGQATGGTRIVTPDLGAGASTYIKAGRGKENG